MVDHISTVSWCWMQKRGGYSRLKNLPLGIKTARTFFQFQFFGANSNLFAKCYFYRLSGPQKRKNEHKKLRSKISCQGPFNNDFSSKSFYCHLSEEGRITCGVTLCPYYTVQAIYHLSQGILFTYHSLPSKRFMA